MNTFLSLKYKFQNFSTYFITWFFPKGRGKLFWKVYVYMRWVDDIIDNMSISQDYKRKFLSEQKRLLKSIYVKKKIRKLKYEEKGLYDVIKLFWKDKKAKELKKHIFNMMWTFEYDIDRVGKHIKEKEFMKYSKYIGGAYASIFIFCGNIEEYELKYDLIVKKNTGCTIKKNAIKFAHYCHIIHTIRDCKKDEDLGYINYPVNGTSPKIFFRTYILTIKKEIEWLKINKVCDEINSTFIRLVLNFFYNKFYKYIKNITKDD